MAPAIHPPCTPSASCQPPRCHPSPPPCEDPEQCLRNTIARNVPPCQSAVSIMATRNKTRCAGCCKFQGEDIDDPRRLEHIEQYLRRKRFEAKLKREDMITGGTRYLDYTRKLGNPRETEACCAGHGHRGRLMKPKKKDLKSKQLKNQKDPTCRGGRKKKGGGCTIL